MIPAEVDCWLVRDVEPADDAVLSAAERRRADAMRSDDARRRFVHGRSVVRQILAARLGIAAAEVPIERAEGRIRLVGHPDCHVSVSHAGDVVAVAVGDTGPVGIDIETTQRRHDRVPDVALTPRKVAVAAALVGDRLGPLGAWVAQEAAVKADGIGLAFPLAEMSLDHRTGGIVVRLGERSAWGVTLRALPDLVVAVAIAGPPPLVRCRTGRNVARGLMLSGDLPDA